MSEIRVARYESTHKSLWDDFVRASKNGTFLFYRDYTEYHADRFTDRSLLFFEDNKLVAVLPASVSDDIVSSHGGLTYGGVICGDHMKTSLMLRVFEALLADLRQGGIRQLIYKVVPQIYHRAPAEEDLYALYINNAQLIRRDVSAAILLQQRLPVSKGRERSFKKIGQLQVAESKDFNTFMEIEEAVLRERHNKKPVHSAAELVSLAEKFPDHIKLVAAFKDGEMLGGMIVYADGVTAHAQYICANEEGKRLGAQDAVVNYLLNTAYSNKRYFDFGISTEDNGRYLNTGLQQNKESYGARAVVYDFYRLDLESQGDSRLV